MSKTLEQSPNALMDKSLLDRYASLPIADDRIVATYIWIDGTGEEVRAKDRTLDSVPKSPKGALIQSMVSARHSPVITSAIRCWAS